MNGNGAGAMARWYVVQARPHQEARAETQLARQGFTTFLPTYLKTIRHGRQFRTSRAPLFPRYLFVRFSVDHDRWRSVNGTFGVSRLVTAGDQPLPVPTGAVEDLMAAERQGAIVALEEGASVRIANGPFAGFTGRLLRLDPGGRVRVLLSILGGDVPLMVEANVLFPAA